MTVGVENYWRFNGIETPSMKARTKVLASFEAGMKSPNLPWRVNITSLKHRSRFGEVPDKSPTFKIYTTSALSYVAVIYFGPQGQREQRRG